MSAFLTFFTFFHAMDKKVCSLIDILNLFAVGGGSILWKVSHWQPVEKLLVGTASGKPMDRSLQFELVDRLTDICTGHHIDPDKMDDLLSSFDEPESDPGGTASIFVDAILEFFNTHMKMQE